MSVSTPIKIRYFVFQSSVQSPSPGVKAKIESKTKMTNLMSGDKSLRVGDVRELSLTFENARYRGTEVNKSALQVPE